MAHKHDHLFDNPAFIADLQDSALSARLLAEKWGTGKTFIAKHRNRPLDAPAVVKSTVTTETSSDGSRRVQFIRDRPVTLEDAREWIRSSGDNPDHYILNVRAIAYGHDQSSNTMDAKLKPGYKPVGETLDIDPVQIFATLRTEDPPVQFTGEGAFVISLNDTQFGKDEGGGSVATIARVTRYINLAKERALHLSANRNLGTLVIIGGGDIVEGCVIYPNQSYNIDLDRRGQINAAVSMILLAIDTLAPLFERVIVLAARGNHGENRINGNRTTLHDNDDVTVFEMARYATQRDPNLRHVEYIIADSEAGVWVDVAGWRLATTHGDVYGKGVPGASIDKKAQNWYKNMSMGRDPLGLADVLITHHYHHDKMSDWGACLWRQTPALDGGSEYFRQSTGEYSEPGMLTFVMTPERRYVDEEVIR